MQNSKPWNQLTAMEKAVAMLKKDGFLGRQHRKYGIQQEEVEMDGAMADSEVLTIWLNYGNEEVALLKFWMTEGLVDGSEATRLNMDLRPVGEPSEWLNQRPFNWFRRNCRPEHVVNWVYYFVNPDGKSRAYLMSRVLEVTRFFGDHKGKEPSYVCGNCRLEGDVLTADIHLPKSLGDDEMVPCTLTVKMATDSSSGNDAVEILLQAMDGTHLRNFCRNFPPWRISNWMQTLLNDDLTYRCLSGAFAK